MTHATNKGGKTLLVPTPYSIKMALVDACFRGDQGDSEELARKVFDLVKARQIRVAPPEHCLVHNTFIKILDHDRNEAAGPYRSTIAYREFAFYKGVMSIAADASGLEAEAVSFLSSLFHRINQFGKRGSFLQCLAADTRT